MAARVIISPRADRDIDDIWAYIAAENIDAANSLIERISATAETFAKSPLAGRARPELRHDIRSFPVGKYIVFYKPISDGMEIVRLLHGSRRILAKHLR